MGLNCQLTLDGWVEANLLSNLKSKLFFFMHVAFIRLFVPFNTVYGQLMQLYKYRKHLDYFDYFLKGWLIVTGGSSYGLSATKKKYNISHKKRVKA